MILCASIGAAVGAGVREPQWRTSLGRQPHGLPRRGSPPGAGCQALVLRLWVSPPLATPTMASRNNRPWSV